MSDDNQQQATFSQSSDDQSQQQQQQKTVVADDTNKGQQGDHAFLIVGERAFATKDDVSRNITAAQTHIKTLEQENAKYRDDVKSLSEEVTRLKTALEGMQQGTTSQTSGKENQTGALSKEELVTAVVQQVRHTMTAEEREVQRKTNINTVFSEAVTAYGDKDKMISKVAYAAKELHMSMADVDELAKNNPRVFRQLFIPQKQSNQSAQPTDGDVNTSTLNGKTDQTQPFNVTKHTSKEIAAEVARRLAQ